MDAQIESGHDIRVMLVDVSITETVLGPRIKGLELATLGEGLCSGGQPNRDRQHGP
jgi:hypothetical protein